ncbi:MAG: DUF2306 domain-containing protein, partial [Sphingomonadaceae bacterium]|nr:DUF2306 domain-containing protein [Sphingomonadaceae bacterium]
IVFAGVVAVAVLRGRSHWAAVPAIVWLHLAMVSLALLLTPAMLLRRKGTRAHRVLGYVWAAAMVGTAALSLVFRTGAPHGWGVFTGDVSPVHILSVVVLVLVPMTVNAARRHDVAGHRRGIRGLVIGALLVAGFFTLPFDRLLGHWLLG